VNSFLITYSLAVGAGLFFLGKRKSDLKLWAHIDLYYYPLAIVGVILLFLSASEGRQHLSALTAYQRERQLELVTAANSVIASSFYLSKFLFGVVDPDATCKNLPGDDPLRSYLSHSCREGQSEVSRIVHTLFMATGPFKIGQLMGQSLSPSCKSVLERETDAIMWQKLYTIRGDMDSAARKTAHQLFMDLARSCKEYLGSFIRATENIPPSNRDITGSRGELFPTAGLILLGQLREWLWPFVLILALALKLGKAAAE
jgi:hypothetical protein